jgi:hypothetical protein
VNRLKIVDPALLMIRLSCQKGSFLAIILKSMLFKEEPRTEITRSASISGSVLLHKLHPPQQVQLLPR